MADTGITARVSQDCARKVRIYYSLPHTLTERFLEFFPRSEVCINRFSELVAGASDHFSVNVEGKFLVKGALGSTELEVTFWKNSDGFPEKDVEVFTGILQAAFSPKRLDTRPITVQETS